MKRISMLLLMLAMLLSLAACGLTDTQPAGNAEDTQPAEQTVSDAAKETPTADAQKPENNAAAPDAPASSGKQEETKADDAQKDEQKPETSQKTEEKQETQKPADTASETAPETPGYGNGSLTVSQVKELQRWYGVSADGQWGAGSAKAAGGRTADEAWAYYRQNKKDTTPQETAKPAEKPDNSATGGGAATAPAQTTEPAKPAKADIDCAAAMSAGNSYAEGYGFTVDSACRSYFPPIYLEHDCPESCWNQEWVESAIKQKVDYVKNALERNGEWYPEIEGWYVGINCVVRWNASAGYHEIFVYYGG